MKGRLRGGGRAGARSVSRWEGRSQKGSARQHPSSQGGPEEGASQSNDNVTLGVRDTAGRRHLAQQISA